MCNEQMIMKGRTYSSFNVPTLNTHYFGTSDTADSTADLGVWCTYLKVQYYFQCRNGAGSKWPPVLKVWEQLSENRSKVGQKAYRQKAFVILL